MSRRVPGLRLHFVNVNGTATRGGAAEDGSAPRGGHGHEHADRGADRWRGPRPGRCEPRSFPRRDWGAAKCPPREAPVIRRGEGGLRAPHRLAERLLAGGGAGIVLAICRYHRNSNGWNDIGYQALVDKYGVLYEGRAGGLDKPVIGAKAQGFNAQSTGIASIGDNTVGRAVRHGAGLPGRYIRWKLAVHGVPLAGQATLAAPAAPPAARRRPPGPRAAHTRPPRHEQHRLPGHRPLLAARRPARPRGHRGATAGRGHVPHPLAVQDEGPLRRGGGSRARSPTTLVTPLPGQPVKLQVLRAGRWHTLGEL